DRRDLGAEAGGANVFMHDKTAMRAPDRSEHGFAVPWRERAKINDVGADASLLSGGFAAFHHRAPGDNANVIAVADALSDAERQREIVARIGAAGAGRIEHVAVLQEHHRIVAAQG